MALDLNLTLNQTQKLTMTPELKQALNILQLNVIDLSQYLDEQLELNPVLETSEPEVSNIVEWNNYINRNKSEDSEYNDDNEDYSLESYVPTRTSLREHLLFQLHVMPINMSIRKVCKYIIDSMNANGYLTASLGELAKNTNESIHTVEKALEIVQEFDPPGVGARDLKECLLLQLAAKDILDEDFKNLIRCFDLSKFHEYRDCTIIELIMDTGMRVGETLLIKLSDVDMVRRSIYLPPENTKSKKGRMVFFSAEMDKSLKSWLQFKDRYRDSDYLFCTNNGKPVQVNVFERNFRMYASRIGLKNAHPHMLRNNFAKRFLMNGGDIYTLSRLLGHSSVTVTEKAYLDLNEEDLRVNYAPYSPLKNIMKKKFK